MAFVQRLLPSSIPPPVYSSRRHSLTSTNTSIFPCSPLKSPTISLPLISCSAPKSLLVTEQDALEAVAMSDGKSLPGVRTFENDLARLSLVGAVDFEQALTAAAADDGVAAAEHIASGMPAMVVETVYPGPPDEHSTISTRLFLPASKVKQKAKKLRNSLNDDILFGSTSENILAMTFRQVVIQQLWNYELVLFRPGTERNMKDLGNPREVPASFTLSASDVQVLSMLAEVVCLTALESTERHFLDNTFGQITTNLFQWFPKSKEIASKDSSVILYKLFEDDIVANAKSLLDNFSSEKEHFKLVERKSYWWRSSVYSRLEKIGGSEFSSWASEYVPSYRLEIDPDKVNSVKFEGWQETTENKWEVLLTHSQMVDLANILDLYYEDLFTLPNKQLSCGVVAKATNLSISKRNTSWLKILSITVASGFFLLAISIWSQVGWPRVKNGVKYLGVNRSLQSSEFDYVQHQNLESSKLEAFCASVVNKVKDSFGWSGEIKKEIGIGAWTGELPVYLTRSSEAESESIDISSISAGSEGSDDKLKTSAQEIASYQVVLSADGKIIGLQPTSRVAVNQWAANPLAKELYGGRKLSPGFIEPGLKISQPSDIVVLELLMSVNPESYFALARPVS